MMQFEQSPESPALLAALEYARRSWPVAPAHNIMPNGRCSCGGRRDCSPGKHPRTKNGLTDATLDEQQIREWWTRWPDANVLVRTGMVGDRCLVVLDIDPKHDGDESLRMLEARHGVLPVTPRAITGSLGEHHWFWSSIPIQNSTSKIARGVDTRGVGGYVIVPPSNHESGNSYEWDAGAHPDEVPLAEAPAWLATIVGKREVLVSTPVANAFIEGGRNNALTSLAGSMRDKGFEREAIEAALLVENEKKCRPPLDPRDVQRIARSVARYAPRDAPDATPRRALTFSDVVAKWKEDGPVAKAPTGWPTLDDAAGGGLPFGRFAVLVGAPNAGKTAVAAALADRYWRAGHIVGLHAIDEDPDDVTVRFAQMAGFRIEDAESGDVGRLEEIATALREEGVFIYDHGWTIEAAASDLNERAKVANKRSVYVVDSIQTTRSSEAAKADSPRLAVDATVRAIRTVTSAYRLLTIATSEMGRAGYRNEDAARDFNDMAAGKESSSIEYGAKIQLVLRSVKDFPGVIRVGVPKLKRGREVDFFLQLNRATHAVFERAAPLEEDMDAAKSARARREASEFAKALRDIVLREPGIGEEDLRAEWSRRGLGGITKLGIAKRELGDELHVQKVGRRCVHRLRLVKSDDANLSDSVPDSV
jgi:KaiC/GvpD/RAD55 family RecA-like ATPase